VSKYRNRKTEVDGIVFDSKKEAERYGELTLLEKAKKIEDLELQPKFPVEVNGQKICTYIADFRYKEKLYVNFAQEDWHVGTADRIEDVKSEATRKLPVYRLKKKLVEAQYGITITEV
jgi:hypothetical protein